MEFPSSWDNSNPHAHDVYNRCKKYYSSGDEDKFVNVFKPSIFSRFICGELMNYIVISVILILIKKKAYVKMNCNITLLLLFSFGALLSVIIFYFRRVLYFDFPCFVIPYSNAISLPLCIFSSAGIIISYLKQCYNNASLYNKHYNEDKLRNYKRGYLHKVCFHFSEKYLIKLTLIFITMSLLYVTFFTMGEYNYTIYPSSQGFCTLNYELAPGWLLLIVFLFGFLPMAIHDFYMFRGNFSFIRTLSATLISSFLMVTIYVVTVNINKYTCSSISRYFPSEFFMIMFFFIFYITHITVPLIESYIVNKHVNRLELTKKGLYKVFDDELLYKEFFEYAVKKRSVEYALFHVEYVEFKNLFKFKIGINTNVDDSSSDILQSPTSPTTTMSLPFLSSPISTISPSNFLTSAIPAISPTSPSTTTNVMSKKLLQTYEQIYTKATDIFEKYFKEDSELELNLPGKLVKSVTNSYYDYTIYYNRYVVNGTGEHEIDMNKIDCETLFDDVHEEAMDSLFLNVYSSFAKDKKKVLEKKSSHDNLA
ncbi:hypothetical protein BCR32DRAFT_268171 [Anaeromyces robustus]|uniref:Uncharacterized protein n=1 Tax=Anaeromyces robustus TaxID=1754192 RepID=A0A1Y1X8B9_9FUNG|nr:hypothetical protein BCR32DRAFT_268171 [Anaeromyces robustus]|eukprot:ORX81656.1 hypothetical protein BCR32DRAFT_268171 [Anaeromyces robustus]